MIGAHVKFTPKQREVQHAVDKAAFKNISHAAFGLRKLAWSRIGRAPQDTPSAPGTPPHTHRGSFYKRALFADVNKQQQNAVIGFRKSVVGMAASKHEHGLRSEDNKFTFPQRPTIGPALEDSLSRIGDQWKGSIGA